MLLDIQNLKVEARTDTGWTPILHGVDLQVNRGEVVGLIGESGAGKSTLGQAALGYAAPGLRFAGGRILFDGADLLPMSDQFLSHVSVVVILVQAVTCFFLVMYVLINCFYYV